MIDASELQSTKVDAGGCVAEEREPVEWPRISVVTPSYNQGEFLEATLRSIHDQGYPHVEHIVMDGGSTDGSKEIIRRYEDRLAHWESAPDRGQYDAVNRGLQRATGEIMGWLNSDDFFLPWTFRTVASIFTALPEVQWLSTLRRTTCDWRGYCIAVNRIPGFAREAFLDGCYMTYGCRTRTPQRLLMGCIQQEGTFWRRSLWERVGGLRPELDLAADFDLWARFYEHAELYGVISPLAMFRFQAAQRSAARERYIEQAHRSLAEMRSRLGWKRDAVRSVGRALCADRVPGVSRIQALYAYRGRRVSRVRPETPEGCWVAEEHPFFPEARV